MENIDNDMSDFISSLSTTVEKSITGFLKKKLTKSNMFDKIVSMVSSSYKETFEDYQNIHDFSEGYNNINRGSNHQLDAIRADLELKKDELNKVKIKVNELERLVTGCNVSLMIDELDCVGAGDVEGAGCELNYTDNDKQIVVEKMEMDSPKFVAYFNKIAYNDDIKQEMSEEEMSETNSMIHEDNSVSETMEVISNNMIDEENEDLVSGTEDDESETHVEDGETIEELEEVLDSTNNSDKEYVEMSEEEEYVEMSEEEEALYEIEIDGESYYTTDETMTNGDVFNINKDGDPGDMVGTFKDGNLIM